MVILFGEYNNGVEFSGSIEPHQVNVLVKGRGNLSVEEADFATKLVESIILDIPGVSNAFAQAGPSIGGGDGAPNMGDGRIPADTIGIIRVEFTHFSTRVPASQIVRVINERAERFAGIEVEIKEREQGPPQGKGIEIEVSGQNLNELTTVTSMTQYMQSRDDLYIDVENTLPLPGIEWNLSVDREAAGRFQADIVTVGNVIQLVTNGILIGHYRPDDSDDEIEIRARYPYGARSFDQLDQLRVLTPAGNVPITNFVKREPSERRDAISRTDGQRVIQIQAAMAVNPETGSEYLATDLENDFKQWMAQQDFVPSGVKWRLRGANEEAEEAAAFLGRAMIASLMLMFIILLMQFNSLYCTMLTLSTVVLSTIGVLLGMIVTGQVFSVIMTGTGVVALAGIVVNNSIVLIDTYQRLLATGMDRVDVILKTAGQRLRPILLTTVTTMIGLFPMAIQASINVIDRSIEFGEPTAAWWVQLSTAIIFGLGFSTLLTLILGACHVAFAGLSARAFCRLRGSSICAIMRGNDSPAE